MRISDLSSDVCSSDLAGYANKELDALLDAANTELDQAKRAEIYHQAEAIVNEDLPMVYLWVAKELYGVSDKVSGWQPSADSRMNLHDDCVKSGPQAQARGTGRKLGNMKLGKLRERLLQHI